MKIELETIFERDVLPVTISEFPIVRRMTLEMNSTMVVPSIHSREAVEQQQTAFTHSWDPLIIGCSGAVYFHTCEIKLHSWTTHAKKMRASITPMYEVR